MRERSIHQCLVPAAALSRLPRAGMSGLLVLREVAKVLGVSVVTVRRRVRDGSLPAHRIKGRLYVKPEELRAYVERHAEVPASLEADARAFVGRGAGDWLAEDGSPPLRAATQANYLGALRCAAGVLVAAGVPPDELRTLADLARPDRVRTVLRRVAARTGRERGGQLALLAAVLLMAGRDHAGLPAEEVAHLEDLLAEVKQRPEMGERTLERLLPFQDGGARLDALLALPARLAVEARRHGKVDLRSARLVRCALFLSLLLDLGARSGNVCALDLGAHVLLGRGDEGWVDLPAHLVKNGEALRAPLSAATVRLLRLYRDAYRPVHAGGTASSWLFPRPDGSHWPVGRACAALMDLTAERIGAAVNPHLVRALLGQLVLEERPGAIGLAKDVLGHD